jgi:hypothetical protein
LIAAAYTNTTLVGLDFAPSDFDMHVKHVISFYITPRSVLYYWYRFFITTTGGNLNEPIPNPGTLFVRMSYPYNRS